MSATYKAQAKALNVHRSAFYPKLNGIETPVNAALLRKTAQELEHLIEPIRGQSPALLAGYQTRIVDGNVLAATGHR